MKPKAIPMFAASLFLAACAATGADFYQGQSATYGGDNILRNDVFKEVRRYERLAHNCRDIRSVRAVILGSSRADGRLRVSEQWTVDACGQARVYGISLREDERGETDFSIRLQTDTEPAPNR